MFAPRQLALLAAAILAACAALPSSSAFTVPALSRFAPAAASSRRVVPSGTTALSMTDGGGDGGPDFDGGIVPESVSTPSPATPPPASKEPEGTEYPLDVPSPILLGGSMILGIASIGSIFELSGGHPVNGFVVSAAIAALGFPLCLFLFYAAIKKGQAETEEDDKAFLNNKY